MEIQKIHHPQPYEEAPFQANPDPNSFQPTIVTDYMEQTPPIVIDRIKRLNEVTKEVCGQN